MTNPSDWRENTPPQEPPPGNSVRVPLPMYNPLWTYIFLGINVLVFLAMTVSGGSENALVLIRFGAKYNPLVAAGEYWRLLSAGFVHIGIIHLAFNSYALYSFGMGIEQRYGAFRFPALYLLSALAGNVASFLGPSTLSAGASGAIFGLVGASIAYFLVYRNRFGQWGRQQLRSVLTVAALNLFLGATIPGIDNRAHIGGLLAGLALGWAYCPDYRVIYSLGKDGSPYQAVDRPRIWRTALVTLALIVLLIALTYLGTSLNAGA